MDLLKAIGRVCLYPVYIVIGIIKMMLSDKKTICLLGGFGIVIIICYFKIPILIDLLFLLIMVGLYVMPCILLGMIIYLIVLCVRHELEKIKNSKE